MHLCPDVISFPESPDTHPDRWVVMNVFTRQCLGIGPEAMAVLGDPTANSSATYRIWRIWRFSHVDGLLADPSRFTRNAATWGDPEMVDHATLISLLEEQTILIDDLANYRARFDYKKSLLDRRHFGTYHQQLGQQLIAFQRRDPASWWLEQKFTTDLAAIRRDNLYGAVQDEFLNRWLPGRVKPGMSVLDLGCGAGVISRKIADLGASVLGVDPNAEYIRIAKEHASESVEFQVLDLNGPGGLAGLADASFDCIFMSDALLFYYVPYEPEKPLDLPKLIADVKRLLRPAGRFLSLEPHPAFYAQPWLGDPYRPFTIVTEYLHTQWRINPPLAPLTRPFLEAGFSITAIEEPACDPANPHIDSRTRHFAAEFPVWLLVEFQAPAV